MELNSSRYDDSSVPYIGTRQYALNKHVAKWLVGDHNRTQYITILGFLLGRKKKVAHACLEGWSGIWVTGIVGIQVFWNMTQLIILFYFIYDISEELVDPYAVI